MTNNDHKLKWNSEQVKAYKRLLREIARARKSLDLTKKNDCYPVEDGSNYITMYSSDMLKVFIETNIEGVSILEKSLENNNL